ncbi:MAG: cytochrome c peroxidase [Reyranellaceae bacterium]
MTRPASRAARETLRATLIALAAATFGVALTFAAPLRTGTPPGMPEGTDFGLDQAERPRQVLRAEAQGGRQSFLVALGNTAFSAPSLFGPRARAAGLSCDTCHRQGHTNPRFFIPGLSARHGGLDPMTGFFNPMADDGVMNHIDIPSLRGVRYLAPYGRDGRIASLREFTRNVIVGEFGGAEPSPLILDALVAYMEQFEFLPNPRIDRLGQLTSGAGDTEKRGQALFNQPFAGMAGRSCASCHQPQAAFADRQTYDVGSGGRFRPPTLMNANFSAPYFHDGRFADYGAVIDHFDKTFALALSATDKADLIAYLNAVGDGEEPLEPVTRQNEMSELAAYVAVLDRALAAKDLVAVDLVVDTVNYDLRQISVRFDNRDPRTGRPRRPDRPDVARIAADLVVLMSAVGEKARAGDVAGAQDALRAYRARATALVASYPQSN